LYGKPQTAEEVIVHDSGTGGGPCCRTDCE
jgi:hypothetical protein